MRATKLFLFLIGCAMLGSVARLSAQNVVTEARLEVQILSSRPEIVSGGNVLVEVKSPGPGWQAHLNQRDVTAAFHLTGEPNRYRARLDGLRIGPNTLAVNFKNLTSRIEIVNHSLAGPIFSGPHQEPFVCQTEASGLGPATSVDCDAPTVVEYYYKSTDELPPLDSIGKPTALGPGFKIYDPSAPPPTDVAKTTTSDGQTMPFIVRREIGVINRAAYDIEFLHQPGQALPSPWARPNGGWNGRLVYLVGGGAAPGYIQGNLGNGIGSGRATFLSKGYAVASATLSIFGITANDRVGAETLSMVKEHFIKEYGPPVHVIGWGGSGGAMEQDLIVQNYPGLLNGVITYLSYPDYVTSLQSATDCQLFYHFFDKSSLSWTDAQRSAVMGFSNWETCKGWGVNEKRWQVQNPQGPCPEELPKAAIYDPSSNPLGTRCDFYSTWIAVLGKNPLTGHVNRPLDNLGVQYGLVAFNRRLIDAEHFVGLNESIGGFDDDGAFVPARSEAPPEALRNAYKRGLVFSGSGGAGSVPILDWRQYGDDVANQHDSFRSFAVRERLRKANGSADNLAILTSPRWTPEELAISQKIGGLDAVYQNEFGTLLYAMDKWLDAIDTDKGGEAVGKKILRNKPLELADGCWAADGTRIVETRSYGGTGKCAKLYPPYGDPRIGAGGPLADDVLKCALKPIDRADYKPALTDEQFKRLEKIFPLGVCDYTKPGVGQALIRATWQEF
jgi:hypothetical protein